MDSNKENSSKLILKSKTSNIRVIDDDTIKGNQKGSTIKYNDNIEKTYTVDDAIEKSGFGLFQVKLAFLTGCAYMSDSMEMMVLSILAPALSCEWEINEWEKAMLSTIVFIGMGTSSTIWGKICDAHGRKTGLLMCTFISLYFGLLSAFAPSLIWLMALRAFVGFGIGGAPQAFTMFSEFSPKNARAKTSTFLSFFWPIGACFEVGLAIFIMPTLGWRYLLGITCIPLAVFGAFCLKLPESARYYMAVGQNSQALKTLEDVAKANKSSLPEGRLVSLKGVQKTGRFMDLFSKEHRLHTPILWIIWFSNIFGYYGIVLLTSELFELGNACSGSGTTDINVTDINMPCSITCLKQNDYIDIFYTSLAEFPGLVAAVFFVEILGRKKALFVTLIGFSFFSALLNLCLTRTWLVIIVFIARCMIACTNQIVFIYTPEYYPTTIRAIGFGACSGIGRLGAIITPFVAQVLMKQSPHLGISIYAGIGFLCSFLSFFLPETKGRNLKS